jgi:predicted metal-binding protein
MLSETELIQTLLNWGAYRAAVIAVAQVEFQPEFRKMCESNACGMYGKSWMCPPSVGPVDDLIAKAKTYRSALVYQTVDPLEDSYDFEGMMAAGQRMNTLTRKIRSQLADQFGPGALHLGSGGCRLCSVCAKREEKPCRFPDQALASLEAYGINVSRLAEVSGMKYINGPDTVTYFGAVLFDG